MFTYIFNILFNILLKIKITFVKKKHILIFFALSVLVVFTKQNFFILNTIILQRLLFKKFLGFYFSRVNFFIVVLHKKCY